MTLVRIVKDWDSPNLMRQTHGSKGVWDGIQFTLDPVGSCDYCVVLNTAPPDTIVTVECPPENIWAVMQEPPNEWFRQIHKGLPEYSRVYTQDTTLTQPKYRQSQPALPWHVDKDYDYLINAGVPRKDRNLSWITSDMSLFSGHKDRMRFLDDIRGKVEFDLFGKGFTFIEDKWDGLAPYRYSLAIENFKNPYYWSEKIADCFLSWTMPVYYGCTQITEYFPTDSMILIDINDPDAPAKIREAVSGDRWEKNLDAIAEARRLVLNKYQLFPFISQQIRGECPGGRSMPTKVSFKGSYEDPSPSIGQTLRRFFSSAASRTYGRLRTR